jgi:hypothetical protein
MHDCGEKGCFLMRLLFETFCGSYGDCDLLCLCGGGALPWRCYGMIVSMMMYEMR